MKFLIVVNESPWGSGVANSALQFARAASGAGHQVDAVFFSEDGVYNAERGTSRDAGSTDLHGEWRALAGHGTRLLVCSSSWRRRHEGPIAEPFIESGLADALERMLQCDRVVTF